jgi:ubiquinone/menaquinone biosynthesis C-methylase UbiE
MGVVADALFEHPRLAEIYDTVDGERTDLDLYLDLVDELGVEAVLDVGCGTGTLACRLASRGKDVTALDPAAASLAVARGKPDARRVRWVEADASTLPDVQVDLVTMTGNVAQVVLDDAEWASWLDGARAVLVPGGHLVFEVRDPQRRAWERWTRAETYRRVLTTAAGPVATWIEVTAEDPPFISFRHTFAFEADGAVLTSDSTLRFREQAEVMASLEDAGFHTIDVRDAPDRPGHELVFVARVTR